MSTFKCYGEALLEFYFKSASLLVYPKDDFKLS
jgi:hypothetical protein